jgi:1,4-alpha-glucan branching enzyme
VNDSAPHRLTAHDAYLFREGTHRRLYERLGCHLGADGAHFAVWAPNARKVSVIGDMNGWDAAGAPLSPRGDGTGIWEGEVADVRRGQAYKYRIESRFGGYRVDKADPFALFAETPPATASRAWTLDFEWSDAAWMARRRAANALDAPVSIYELHLGSWRRAPDGTFLGYRALAGPLVDYVTALGFTHVELMPVTEHPFYGSWGYQTTGYFAPTARYGTPQDFMVLVDALHRAGVGVILDWVPSHFPDDPHGLAFFDGTHLYEHADPRQGIHPEWHSRIFNYGRDEVRAFLLSSAAFWLDRYHVDGLRVDGVASMLYLDYGRQGGDWIPNPHGGRENLAAIEFLRELNAAVYADHPDVQTIAEESTAWPMVSRPVELGGLGFGMKWNMGWMHDTLGYLAVDPLYRKFHHDRLTFSLWYAFHENFVLPLSHDEVVYGKRALAAKFPGDPWQRRATLRAALGFMWAHPGKKLLFMGGELATEREWAHEGALEWDLLEQPAHAGMQRWVADLNRLYRAQPALHRLDFDSAGFEWIDRHDADASVVSFLRRAGPSDPAVLVICNFTPVLRANYVVGAPAGGRWREALNSDAAPYGGSGTGNFGGIDAAPALAHGRFHSLTVTLPPLATSFFVHESG